MRQQSEQRRGIGAWRVVLVMCVLLVALPDRADASMWLPPPRGVALLPGLSFSTLIIPTAEQVWGVALGGEVSVVWYDLLRKKRYVPSAFGVYVDALYEPRQRRQRVSVGPELVWGPLGLDGGYLATHHEGEVGQGATLRLFASMGVAAMFLRGGMTFVNTSETFVEVGFSLKLPMLYGKKRRCLLPFCYVGHRSTKAPR